MTGPYPRRTEPLPRSLEEVTPEWLTRTLQLRYPALRVEGFDTVQVVNTHTTKLRLKLDLNQAGREAGLPENVCLKANWSGDPLSSSAGICALEARFYHHMREALPVPAPEGYFADWDEDEFNQGLVVMEDLVASEVSFGSVCRPLDIDEAARALEQLSSIHAGWWGSPQLDTYGWLKPSMGPDSADPGQYRHLSDNIFAFSKHPQRIERMPAWMVADVTRLGRAYDALVTREASHTWPKCLVHGDAHLGNTYVTADGERRWLDWQLIRKGRPWRDLAWFLIGALRVEDRRNAEQDLIRHYIDALVARGIADVPDFDHIWHEYRHWPVYGLVAWMGTDEAWQEGDAVLAGLERFAAASEDLETLSLLEKR